MAKVDESLLPQLINPETGQTHECIVNGIPTLGCIIPLFQRIVFWAIVLSGITAVIFIIFAGFKYITSRGDAKQVEGARKTLTFAIVGLILVLSAFLIIVLISNITGVKCIQNFGFSAC